MPLPTLYAYIAFIFNRNTCRRGGGKSWRYLWPIIWGIIALTWVIIFGGIFSSWYNDSSSEETTDGSAIMQSTSSGVTSQEKRILSHLTITTDPVNARVRILNIVPKYYDGIELQPGKYHIEVRKSGYEQYKDWLELKVEDTEYTVTLAPIPESPLPIEEELQATNWPINHCLLAGWVSSVIKSDSGFNQCVLPYAANEFVEERGLSSYGGSSACRGYNSGKYLFRCNPELFGPGPTDYEMQLLNISNARGAEDNAVHKNKGACVSTGGTYIGITKRCLIFSEKLDALKSSLGEKSWIEAMDSYTFERFYRNKFIPLRKYIESFCEFYVGAGDKAKNCASMNIQVKKIVNRANELGLY